MYAKTHTCLVCKKDYISNGAHSKYCPDCKHDEEMFNKRYRTYCDKNGMFRVPPSYYEKFFKDFGEDGLKMDVELVAEELMDIYRLSRDRANWGLRQDVMEATRLGLTYGQYSARYKRSK